MSENNAILDDERLKENPFRMPEGYLDCLESSLNEKIENGETGGGWVGFRRVLKPAVTLAAMFLLIFGMGYGALSLTGTLREPKVGAAGGILSKTGYELIDEGFINSSFVDFYSDDITVFEEMELGSEDILEYLSAELSYEDLSELLCSYDRTTIETYSEQ